MNCDIAASASTRCGLSTINTNDTSPTATRPRLCSVDERREAVLFGNFPASE
jgi:hypothetical protein